MPVVHRLGERVGDAGAHADQRSLLDAELGRDLIGGSEADAAKDIVWQIERILAEAEVRPVLFYPAIASCWEPWVKDLTLMTNSIFNGWRMEDVWLDK
jgi:hypothetical protein